MEIKTVSSEILDFLKKYKKKWYFGGDLERRLGGFHKPSSIGRALRDLAEGEDPTQWIIDKDYEWVGTKKPVRVVKYKYKLK